MLIQPIVHADETPVKVLNGYGMKDVKGKLKQAAKNAYCLNDKKWHERR